jgi:hypothetical protein
MAEAIDDMTRNQRYHALHREARCAKRKEAYHNNPDVIARKAERERKKAERDTQLKVEKEAEKQEKERIRQEKLQLALTTRKAPKKADGALDGFLAENSSGERHD